MSNYIITTERLGLRHWLPSDAEPFAKMNMDKDVMKYFPNTLTTEESAQMMQRIQAHFEKRGFGLFVVEEKSSNRFMGFTGFSVPNFEQFFTPCVEIGWRFNKAFWGKGFASEAAIACLHYGFTQVGLDKIVSFTATINTNSEKVMKRIGMKYINTFDHPKISSESVLCKHVLYEISNPLMIK